MTWQSDLFLLLFLLSALFSGAVVLHARRRQEIPALVGLAYTSVFENMRDAVIILDAAKRVVAINPAAQHLIGGAIGQTIDLVLAHWPTLLPLCEQPVATCLEVTWPQNLHRYFAVRAIPLFFSNKLPAGRAIIWQDITAQKQAETVLHATEQRFETVMQHIPLVAVQGFDQSGTIQYWNDTCQVLYGYSADEVLGKRLQDIFLLYETCQTFEQTLRAVWHGEQVQPTEWSVRTRNGEERYVYSMIFPIYASGQINAVYCMDIDLTERRQVEASLQFRLRYIQFMQQAASDFIHVTVDRLDVQITAVLRDVAELFGVERGYVFLIMPERGVIELTHEWCSQIVQSHQGILDVIQIADFVDFIATLQRGETVCVQTRLLPRTPDTRAMIDVLDLLQIKSFVNIPLFINEQLIGWIGFDAVAREVEWSAETIEAFRLTGQLIANAIHRKKIETQQTQLQAQLLQAQKMEAIGHLAGGVAHDFNNILTAIIGNADLSLMILPVEHPAYEDIQAIQKSARRATNLVRQLLTFARRQAGRPEIVNLNDLILTIASMLRRLIGEHIELVILLEPDLSYVKIDSHQFEQVLLNLAVNARDAMPNGGTLTISTANINIQLTEPHVYVGLNPGQYVQLSVNDTGVGMTSEIKDHIFEPFFTTKAIGQGTGLGLATCFGIIKQHNGHIQVDTAPGQGSCFKVYLPDTADRADNVALAVDSTRQARGSETVLLVEDDLDVRQLAARILRNYGYIVLEAVNGQEALHLVAALAGQNIHLLLTDLVMPQLGGLELSRQLRMQHPDLRVLFMSGYTNQPDSIDQHLTTEQAFLRKPFTPDELIRAVHQALRGKGESKK